jgi:hypothetical protein
MAPAAVSLAIWQLLSPADRIDPGADQIGSLGAIREPTGKPQPSQALVKADEGGQDQLA